MMDNWKDAINVSDDIANELSEPIDYIDIDSELNLLLEEEDIILPDVPKKEIVTSQDKKKPQLVLME